MNPVTIMAYQADKVLSQCELTVPTGDVHHLRRKGVRLMFFTDVYTAPRDRGIGMAGTLAQAAVKIAVARGWDLCTYAENGAFGKPGMKNNELRQWYYRLGFFAPLGEPDWMVRRHASDR